MRKIQIGVMGSMADLKYSKKIEKLAERVGYFIAKENATLVFGAEKDSDSLSSAACRGAKRAGGLIIGVTYGKGLGVYEKNADVIIASGLERGGGRELTLVLSCDVIICLSGGSGTLTEMAIAYQANIPMVVLKNTGGWSNRLVNSYLDARKRLKIESAFTPKEAVVKAIKFAKVKKKQTGELLFLAAVHGNEKIGAEVLSELESAGKNIPWVIGNEEAFKVNKRYIDTDLNRSAPGKMGSNKFEVRRAYQLVKEMAKYKYVVDIHGTASNSGIFIIVTKASLKNLLLAGCLPVKNIVVWPSVSKRKAGPLVSFAKNGVEIECGPKNSAKVKSRLKTIVNKIIDSGIKLEESKLEGKNIFKVYGKLIGKSDKVLKDFKLTKINNEEFYPLLVGQYKGVVCYKMRKIELAEGLLK